MIGQFNISDKSITGWHYTVHKPDLRYVDLYCGDIFLKRLNSSHHWPVPPSALEIKRHCGFVLNFTNQLKDLLPKDKDISVLSADGIHLEQINESISIGAAEDNGDLLREKLSQGWVVDKWGSLKLPFQAKKGLDHEFLDFYCDISAKLKAELNLNLYLSYGSLLGCIRDGTVIPFDDDIDAAYVSQYSNIEDVAREFHDLKDGIVRIAEENSFRVNVVETGQLSIVLGPIHFDIFTSWIDQDEKYNCYFGVSGALNHNNLELKEVNFLDHHVLIPVESELVLEWTYGENWRKPDPYFIWSPKKEVTETMNKLREHGRMLTTAN